MFISFADQKDRPTTIRFDELHRQSCQLSSLIIHIAVLLSILAMPLFTNPANIGDPPSKQAIAVLTTKVVPPLGERSSVTRSSQGGRAKLAGVIRIDMDRTVRIGDAPNMEILAELSRLHGTIGFGPVYNDQPVDFVRCFTYPARQEVTSTCGSTDDYTSLVIGNTDEFDDLRLQHSIDSELLTYALFPPNLRDEIDMRAREVDAVDVTIRFVGTGGFAAMATPNEVSRRK